MEIVCFDMEGTLTPEIWEQIALNTGIDEFNKTTRDIPDYSDLMNFRLDVMKKHNFMQLPSCAVFVHVWSSPKH